ncbi:MAG: ribosome recycling factor [Deltaproteobacteria bacterium]|nr:ribosome recycling factor [Deltaproteobacteria bacterium]
MVNDVLEDLEAGMNGAMEALARELAKRRTGRANVAMLDGIKVDYYGTLSPLNQVAAIQVADPRLITIKPWEKGMVAAIEKVLIQSSLGLNPNSDGELIRIPIPPLTGERRKELVRDIKRLAEEAKVAVRNQRRDGNEMLKSLEKDKEISEDDLRRALTQVQEITDRFVAKVDEVVAVKEREILED